MTSSDEVKPGTQAGDAENLATRCPICEDCEARRDNVGPGVQSWEHILMLETAAEVTAFPRRTDTDELHSAETDGILAHYALPDDVRCSLKGRHPHRKGLVVRTLCDLVLCMGFDCGGKSIIGFEELKADYKRRTSFQQDVTYVGGWASKFGERLAGLRPRLKTLRDTADEMKSRMPELFSALAERRRTKSLEVHVPNSNTPERLRGLVILDADRYDPRKLEQMVTTFRRQYEENPPINGSACSILLRQARAGNRAADVAETWVREASDFVGERNLNVALVALGRGGEVTTSATGITVKYFGAQPTLLRFAAPSRS